MSIKHFVKGKYTCTVKGNYTVYSEGNIVHNAATITQKGNKKGVTYNESVDFPRRPIFSHYILEAEWQNHLGNPITRAIYGQTVYLSIKINYEQLKSWGDSDYFLEFDLYTLNNKKSYYIELFYLNSAERYSQVPITEEGEAKIKLKLLRDGFENLITKTEENLYQLYFDCKIIKKDNLQVIEHRVKLPSDERDYLNVGEIVIDRYKMPGLNAEGTDIADDMTYGYGANVNLPIYKDLSTYKKEYTEKGFDVTKHLEYANRTPYLKPLYTTEEIKDLGTLIKLTDNSENKDLLWYDFNDMSSMLSMGKLNDNIIAMIDKMKENQGGIFENSDLTQAIVENPSTDKYCKEVEDYIIKNIQKNISTLENVEDKEPYFSAKNIITNKNYFSNNLGRRVLDKGKKFGSPIYTWKKNIEVLGFEVPVINKNVVNGETIALNDIWATEVILKELEFKGTEIKGKYEVTLWDHFGLDKPDLEKFYSYGAGFRAWFVLQHRYGYRPFLTKITFEKEFSSKNIKNEK